MAANVPPGEVGVPPGESGAGRATRRRSPTSPVQVLPLWRSWARKRTLPRILDMDPEKKKKIRFKK
eukprot:9869330-Heterocapsa_arctica.AAC.1